MEQPQLQDTHEAFLALMRRVREGSEEAAWELVDQYGESIRRAVRRALNKELRSKFDSLDFVQLVWSSFFRARDGLNRFDRPEQLAAFLLQMARNKVGMEVRRRLSTKKYNVSRERSFDELGSEFRADLAGHQPTPVEVAIAREQWRRMLRDQPKNYRQIIELRLQGHTYQDIADSVHLAQSTVRRFLQRLLRKTVA